MNPLHSHLMVLEPCHVFFQLYVSIDPKTQEKLLNGYFTMRSSDSLAWCYNIVSYSILVHILALRTGMKPNKIMYNAVDCHIYKNHIEQSIEILKRKASPFLFGGISVFYFNPFAEDNNGNKIYLRPLSTEGQGLPMYPDRKQYSLVNMAFPFGGGMKFFVGQKLMLTGEVGFRYTNTDYLDDVSKSYVNLDTLQAYKGHVSKEMSYRGKDNNNPNYGYQRGDSKSNDWYWFANITATVYFRAFGNPRVYLKTKCPGFFRQ